MLHPSSLHPPVSLHMTLLIPITLIYKNTLPPLTPARMFSIIIIQITQIYCHQMSFHPSSCPCASTTLSSFAFPPSTYSSLPYHTNHVTNKSLQYHTNSVTNNLINQQDSEEGTVVPSSKQHDEASESTFGRSEAENCVASLLSTYVKLGKASDRPKDVLQPKVCPPWSVCLFRLRR